MLHNYLTIAVRTFLRQKSYTFLNILGLSIALAGVILTFLYVRHENRYDQNFRDKQIYKVYREWTPGGGNYFTPARLAETLRDEFPEVVGAVYITNWGDVLLSRVPGEEGVFIEGVGSTDKDLFETVKQSLKYGDPDNALTNHHTIVISESVAATFFGDDNPLGQSLRVNDQDDYLVTGVMYDPAPNQTLDAHIFLKDSTNYFDSWTGNSPTTYVRLHPNVDLPAFEDKLTSQINAYLKAANQEDNVVWDRYPNWKLMAMEDVQLSGATISGPFSGSGDRDMIRIIIIVSLVIVIIAMINYMNLATAQAIRRAREVGVRKTNGATRQQLGFQFIAEAILQCLIALPMAILFTELGKPIFEQIIGRFLMLNWSVWAMLVPFLLGFCLVLGTLSGSYPAVMLSAFKPGQVLKGKLVADRGRSLRRGLVVLQFAGAITAAIVMAFIYMQVQHMQQQKLGFETEQLMVIQTNTQETFDKVQKLRHQFEQIDGVQALTATRNVPGRRPPDYSFRVGGVENTQFINIYASDDQIFKTLELELLQGRLLRPQDSTYSNFVVNEAFVKEYQLKDPIGHSLSYEGTDIQGQIVGVVKDFNYRGLQLSIQPLIMSGAVDGWINQVAVRMETRDLQSTIKEVEKAWQLIEPNHPIRYTFLDDDFANLYEDQQRFGRTMIAATLLTLLVALLGLFGLASYMAERRTKEIGVRKVLGASVSSIVWMIGLDFVKLVAVAGAIAAPLAFWLSHNWLENFAYRTEVTVLPFLLAVALAIFVSLLTVSSRTLGAARTKPVDSLKYE